MSVDNAFCLRNLLAKGVGLARQLFALQTELNCWTIWPK